MSFKKTNLPSFSKEAMYHSDHWVIPQDNLLHWAAGHVGLIWAHDRHISYLSQTDTLEFYFQAKPLSWVFGDNETIMAVLKKFEPVFDEKYTYKLKYKFQSKIIDERWVWMALQAAALEIYEMFSDAFDGKESYQDRLRLERLKEPEGDYDTDLDRDWDEYPDDPTIGNILNLW